MLRAPSSKLSARHDGLDQSRGGTKRGRHFGGFHHAEPAARSRPNEDDAPAFLERLHDDLDSVGDSLLFLQDGRDDLAVFVDDNVDDVSDRNLVNRETGRINRFGRQGLPLRVGRHALIVRARR
jgi:hypothetical protein